MFYVLYSYLWRPDRAFPSFVQEYMAPYSSLSYVSIEVAMILGFSFIFPKFKSHRLSFCGCPQTSGVDEDKGTERDG